MLLAFAALSACTLLTHSPHLAQRTGIDMLDDRRGLVISENGEIPYQCRRIPEWEDDLKYVWMVGNYDFRRFRGVEIILFFHGMHSKDYYQTFRKELELLASKRPRRPFVFVGFVDTPHVLAESRSKERWSSLVPEPGQRPERLMQAINGVFKSLRKRFPNLRKEKTTVVLAGFSGGGRVLDSVGNWIARSGKEDPYAEVFRQRLAKMAYFDCWFGNDVLETVPTLLQDNPSMRIVSTVHMKTPQKNAELLASRLNMKEDKQSRELVGMDGRLTIFRNDSHWDAMIARLKEAL